MGRKSLLFNPPLSNDENISNTNILIKYLKISVEIGKKLKN